MPETNQMSMEEALKFFAQRVPVEAPNTFSGQMQPELIHCDEAAKTLTFAFETQSWMRNPSGAIHGGVIAEAISMSINALAQYQASAVHAGKNMAYVSARAWQEGRENKPFATGTGVHYTAAAVEED